MAKDYLFQGTTGNAVSDGTAATGAAGGGGNTGLSQVNAPAPGSVIHRTAARHPGSTLGLRMTSSTAGAVIGRAPADGSSLTMARTSALTLPAPPATGFYTIWTMRASGVVLRLNWLSTGHLQLVKISGSAIDLGAFTAGQKISVQCWMTVGTIVAPATASVNGVLNFQIQAEGGATISGSTVAQTNADLGAGAIIEGDTGFTGAVSDSPALVLDWGPDRWEANRTSFIPQLTDAAAASATGTAASLDSAGGWTATPSGTLVAVVSDNDDTTYALSVSGPTSEDKVRFAIGRVTPKLQLQISMNLQPVGGTGGTWYVRLYDNTTLVQTWSGLVADGIPTVLTLDSTKTAALSKDSGGAWAALHVEFGYGP